MNLIVMEQHRRTVIVGITAANHVAFEDTFDVVHQLVHEHVFGPADDHLTLGAGHRWLISMHSGVVGHEFGSKK